MNTIGTQTKTYTVADIRKVVDNFAADFSMMTQATGLQSREDVAKTVSDLKTFAENGYLIDVKLILKDASGTQIRAAVYRVSDSAVGWTPQRPGNNLWPRTPGGSLLVVAAFTSDWWNKTDAQRASFIANQGLYFSWSRTSEDTTFTCLTSSAGQRYASNGYGWERTNYS